MKKIILLLIATICCVGLNSYGNDVLAKPLIEVGQDFKITCPISEGVFGNSCTLDKDSLPKDAKVEEFPPSTAGGFKQFVIHNFTNSGSFSIKLNITSKQIFDIDVAQRLVAGENFVMLGGKYIISCSEPSETATSTCILDKKTLPKEITATRIPKGMGAPHTYLLEFFNPGKFTIKLGENVYNITVATSIKELNPTTKPHLIKTPLKIGEIGLITCPTPTGTMTYKCEFDQKDLQDKGITATLLPGKMPGAQNQFFLEFSKPGVFDIKLISDDINTPILNYNIPIEIPIEK